MRRRNSPQRHAATEKDRWKSFRCSFFSLSPCLCGEAFLVVLSLLAGCALPRGKDYSAFFANQPRSILVAPVLNDTTSLEAPEIVEATITEPLAERGYYVFPLILTDALFKDLGLSEAGYVHELPPTRFRELFGADAVLFVDVKDWGAKYLVMEAATVVELDFVLKDTRSGETLWTSSQVIRRSSGGGAGGDPIGALIAAAIGYVLSEAIEPDYRPLARQAHWQAFSAPGSGLPAGPYSPQFGADRDRYTAPP